MPAVDRKAAHHHTSGIKQMTVFVSRFFDSFYRRIIKRAAYEGRLSVQEVLCLYLKLLHIVLYKYSHFVGSQ